MVVVIYLSPNKSSLLPRSLAPCSLLPDLRARGPAREGV